MASSIKWSNEASVKAAVQKFPAIFRQEYRTFLRLIAEMLVAETAELAPVGGGYSPTGHLANSISAGEPYVVTHGMRVKYGTPAEYAETIELGRSPGSTPPPAAAIEEWLEAVAYRFPDIKTARQRKSAAFAIARAIGKHGFKGRPKGWGMFTRGQQNVLPKIGPPLAHMRNRIETRCNGAVP